MFGDAQEAAFAVAETETAGKESRSVFTAAKQVADDSASRPATTASQAFEAGTVPSAVA